MAEEKKVGSAYARPLSEKKRNGLIATVVVVVILAVAGVGLYQWHEQPSFCSTMCHIEQTYVDNYSQAKDVPGTDKYGNTVMNTNAMMAVLHSETGSTALPTIACVDCHVPNIKELATDGLHFATGTYYMPRSERTLAGMMSWDGKDGTSFCVNERCHVYLRGSDGLVDRTKLEKTTIDLAFNPHSTHHSESMSLQCGDCHKGHRASVVLCSGCHNENNPDIPTAVIPAGWVSYDEGQQILADAYR